MSMPAVVHVTQKYNDVRFGLKELSETEVDEIETLLNSLKSMEAAC